MNLNDSVFIPDHLHPPKWAVKPGLILSGAGQCVETIHAMQHAIGDAQKPAVIALYESLNRQGYIQNAHIAEAHALFPGAILQIGLQLPLFDKEGLLAIAAGMYEQDAVRMARLYRDIRLPILLRIGYEFDGEEWNGYDPEGYIAAYRYLAGILRREGAENVALVWDSYTVDTENVERWFPGDDVVDWYGYNTIAPRFSGLNNMVELAQKKNKPVLNGEASYSQSCAHLSFEEWIAQFFATLRRTSTAAYQYINWRWKLYPQSAGWEGWQDGHITDQPEKMAAYIREMQGSDMVYRDESYAQPLRMTIDCARVMTDGEPDSPWMPERDQVTCDAGFSYRISPCMCTYGTGWTTAWQAKDSLQLEIRAPAPFQGELLIQLASQEAMTLNINGIKAVTDNGCGYLHIPVSFDREHCFHMQLEGGGNISISHLMVLRTEYSAQPIPHFEQNKIVWDPLDEALLYRIYRDQQLVAMTHECEYTVNEGKHIWHVAACSRTRGAGKMVEVT